MNNCHLSLLNECEAEVNHTWLKGIAQTVCEGEQPSVEYEISLLLCDDEAMRRYNCSYRGSNSVTDVLSFLNHEFIKPESGVRTRLCDIIIDIKQLERQRGHKSLDQELSEVFIHALLHLTGYDHILPQARKIMQEKEKEYQRLTQGTHNSG